MGRYDNKIKAISASLALLFAAGTSVGCNLLHPGDTSPSNTVLASEPVASDTAVVQPSSEGPSETALSRETAVSILLGQFLSELSGDTVDPEACYEDACLIASGAGTVNGYVEDYISSPEFTSLNIDDDLFIRKCFLTFRGIPAGDHTVRFLIGMMNDGMPRNKIADLIMQNEYFAETCSAYGVLPAFEADRHMEIEEWYDTINAIGDTTEPMTIGGVIPSEATLEMLFTAMDTLTEANRDFGFMLLDINTGEGIVYNIDQEFYTASSIKGPFAASFASNDPEGAASWESTITNMLVNSDNDAYTVLNNQYRRTYIQEWCEEIGIDPEPFRYKYPHVSTRMMTALWMRTYQFFETEEFGPTAGAWFEEPVYSLIHSELGDQYVTRSKAGWLVDEDPSHTTTVDGGVVYAYNGPYVVVIMSKVPRDIEPLRPLLRALEAFHFAL